MPIQRKRIYKKKAYRRRPLMRRPLALRGRRPITTNTASVRENYSVSVPDGSVVFFSTALAAGTFDRSQQVAAAFQEYRIKYIKLTMKPSADTFTPAAGNTIPQIYFQMNKYAAIPTNANLQTLLDMGCRPVRFDDKNITRAWKPTVLIGSDSAAPTFLVNAQKPLTTPWLSTNNNAQNPSGTWAPSNVEHLGCCFFVTKINPATPTLNYTLDVEVVFQFRRPLSSIGDQSTTNVLLMGDQLRPVQDVSGNVPLV